MNGILWDLPSGVPNSHWSDGDGERERERESERGREGERERGREGKDAVRITKKLLGPTLSLKEMQKIRMSVQPLTVALLLG